MKVFLITPLFVLLFLTYQNENNNNPRLHVCLNFLKTNLPDSIRSFFKPYLQSKKIKVLTPNETTVLVAEEINKEATAMMNSGDLSKSAIKRMQNNIDPVCNILGIQIFQNQANKEMYLIDSIHWRVSPVPSVDTTSSYIKKMYIPENNQGENPYIILKAFLDHVIASGYLK